MCRALVPLHEFSTTVAGILITCLACERFLFFSSVTGSGRGIRPSKDGLWPAAIRAESSPDPLPVDADSPVQDAPIVPATHASSVEQAILAESSDQPGVPEPLEMPQVAISEPLPTESGVESDSGANRCPKCFAVVLDGAEDCVKCGLHFANVGVTFHPSEGRASGPLEAQAMSLWEQVSSNWGDASLHERFLQYCHSQDLLELAAFQYRKVRELGGEHAGDASVRLERIVELVQQQFLTQQSGKSVNDTVKRGKWFLLLVLFAFGLVAFYVIWGKMSGGPMTQMQLQMP
jgi:hypothetical protein